MGNKHMTVREAAEFLGVSEWWVRKLARQRKIVANKINFRPWKLGRESIEAYARGEKTGPGRMTVQEAAKRLNVSETRIKDLVYKDELVGTKYKTRGREQWWIRGDSVEKYERKEKKEYIPPLKSQFVQPGDEGFEEAAGDWFDAL